MFMDSSCVFFFFYFFFLLPSSSLSSFTHTKAFKSWSRHNYRQFVRACANHGRNDLDMICKELYSASGISAEQVKRYHATYFEKGLAHLGEKERESERERE